MSAPLPNSVREAVMSTNCTTCTTSHHDGSEEVEELRGAKDVKTWLRHRDGVRTSWRAARLTEEKARRSVVLSRGATTHSNTPRGRVSKLAEKPSGAVTKDDMGQPDVKRRRKGTLCRCCHGVCVAVKVKRALLTALRQVRTTM